MVDAAEHGLSGKDDICIAGGGFTITAGKDGVHAENKDDASKGFLYIRDGSFVISADGDALSAGSDVRIDGGDFDLKTGGGAVSVKVQEEAVLEEAGKRPEGDRKMMEGSRRWSSKEWRRGACFPNTGRNGNHRGRKHRSRNRRGEGNRRN